MNHPEVDMNHLEIDTSQGNYDIVIMSHYEFEIGIGLVEGIGLGEGIWLGLGLGIG